MKSSVQTDKDNIYVINMGNDQGFVIVSGESGTDADILGYCDHGSFCYDSCPVQLKDLLDSYSAQIDSLRKHSALAAPRKASGYPSYIGSIVVGPLLTTTWNQWGPYNNQCPEGCPTGCVPTAVAQIMNYWQWPKVSTGRLLDPVSGTFTGEDFSGHVYGWDNMLDSYDGSFTGEQAEAVALLMADIGKALGTAYAPGGSSTATDYTPLTNNFSYSPDIEVHHDNLPAVMKAELDRQRPMLYSATGSGGGHELVCDGYTANNYFHFNYGWGGSYDGFYKQTAVPLYKSNPSVVTGIAPLAAANKVIDNIEYALLENGEAHVVQYTQAKVSGVEVVIPDEVTEEGRSYRVTRIRKNAFYARGNFKKLTLGNNIRSIDPYSFIQSTIDELVIGDGIEEVPDGAFQLTRIQKLTIGASVRRIGKQAFRMCGLGTVVCKSAAFEADDEAFFNCITPDPGAWLGCITSLGYQTFAMTTFQQTPHFDKLERIARQAMPSVHFPNDEFHIPASLKTIEPGAFSGAGIQRFIVDEKNPYFSAPSTSYYSRSMLFNKNGTTLMAAMPVDCAIGYENQTTFPASTVKLERGSIPTMKKEDSSYYRVTIPNTIIEMEGAFSQCERVGDITCLAVVPPAISDTTFNDKIFTNRPDIRLYVPEGTYELYKNAPGWRRFPWIYASQPYEPAPELQREWRMVLHRSGSSDMEDVRIPVSEVADVHVDEGNNTIVVTRSGQGDVETLLADADSITWEPCFVYEDAEVFELNGSTLTAEGQKCSVTFGRTVIDHPVQLAIRNGVLTPRVTDLTLRGQSFDLSLSDGTHELKGVATITVPFTQQEGELVQAAYFNEESGEWEPAYFKYADGEVTIMTNHLSEYCVFTVLNDEGPRAKLQHKWDYSSEFGWNLNQSLGRMYEIASGENIDEASIQAWRDDYSFWQSIGLDGGHNLLSAAGLTSDAISKCVDIVGYLGTAATVLDVAKADLQGDDVGVASNTLKAILGFTTGQAASAIGTSMMSVSMAGVAFIGVALEKFGTMVQKRKTDLYRAAYRLYYSEQGRNIVGNLSSFGGSKYYRTESDWYDYFYPAFQQGMKDEQLRNYIEQSVRMYCERFWDENGSAQSLIIEEAKTWGLSTMMYPDEALRKTISDEYFAELMNGTLPDVGLPSVFQQLKHNIEVQSFNRYKKARKDYIAMMNTDIGLQFIDSQCKEGERSKYAGWKLRFNDAFEKGLDTQFWEREISEQGRAKMGWYTLYAFLHNGIKNQVTLVNPQGVEQKTFTYQVNDGTGKHLIEIVLATGGVEIEAPALKDLQLTYDPVQVSVPYTWAGTWGNNHEYHESQGEMYIMMDNAFNKQARFQYEIERFFKQHDFITVDGSGNVKIGDDIVAKFEKGQNQANGTCTINTTHQFVEKTLEQYVEAFNKNEGLGDFSGLYTLLHGTVGHKIDCNFTVTRTDDADGTAYTVSYTGKGTYTMSAEVVDKVNNYNFDEATHAQNVTTEDVLTRSVEADGTVTLQYTTTLQ